ncbi:uncharacterized protein METZ01_LOCUS32423, partial [marine metagenome]
MKNGDLKKITAVNAENNNMTNIDV